MFTLLSGFILGAKLLAVVNHTEPTRKKAVREKTRRYLAIRKSYKEVTTT